jgi:hypothetical protein
MITPRRRYPMTASLRERVLLEVEHIACTARGHGQCYVEQPHDYYDRATDRIIALLAETPGEAGLRRDALALLEACELADEQGELADNIDGSLMDNLRDHFPDTDGIEGPLTFDELVKRAPPAPAKGEDAGILGLLRIAADNETEVTLDAHECEEILGMIPPSPAPDTLRDAAQALVNALYAYAALAPDRGMRHAKADAGRELWYRLSLLEAALASKKGGG